MSDTIKIKVWVSTNTVGSECKDYFEIDREEWDSMTPQEQEGMCREAAFEMLDWGFEVE